MDAIHYSVRKDGVVVKKAVYLERNGLEGYQAGEKYILS